MFDFQGGIQGGNFRRRPRVSHRRQRRSRFSLHFNVVHFNVVSHCWSAPNTPIARQVVEETNFLQRLVEQPEGDFVRRMRKTHKMKFVLKHVMKKCGPIASTAAVAVFAACLRHERLVSSAIAFHLKSGSGAGSGGGGDDAPPEELKALWGACQKL